MHGQPEAIASSATSPNGSYSDGTTHRSAIRYRECSTSSPVQPTNEPCSISPSRSAWAFSSASAIPDPATRNSHAAESVDQPRYRVEREMEPLLVHEPADEQHQLLVLRREPRAQPGQVGDRLQVGRVDPVRDSGHPIQCHPEHVRPRVSRM